MKVLFISNSVWSLSSIHQLVVNHQFKGLVVNQTDFDQKTELVQAAKSQNWEIIPWSNDEDLIRQIQTQSAELGIMLGFKNLIPKTTIEAFPKGIINIHFGRLPDYAGPDPLFWILKNGDRNVEITYHFIDENWDAGIEISQKTVQVFPGENYGLLGARLANIVALELPKILELINSGLTRDNRIALNPKPKGKPKPDDVRIDWKNQSSEEIEHLVNACNPAYGGAITIYKGSQIRILEVSPADLENQGVFSPGGIVYSDSTYGIFVLCADFKCLRINLLKFEGSYISSQKFSALGVKAHEKFD